PAKCAEFPLSHSDHDGYMSKPKNQNRTFHLLQKADILTCYEQFAIATVRKRPQTNKLSPLFETAGP
ncbi:MAG: hypothetical protein ABSD63_18670, partial [Candidatus Korobacteraceae bacterium]